MYGVLLVSTGACRSQTRVVGLPGLESRVLRTKLWSSERIKASKQLSSLCSLGLLLSRFGPYLVSPLDHGTLTSSVDSFAVRSQVGGLFGAET